MMKLIDTLARDKEIGLSKDEILEIVDELLKQRGFIYPHKVSDLTGYPIVKIEALLLKLSIKSFLRHFVVPKYKEKVLQEEAEEGFSFNNFHEVMNKEEGYFNETINSDLSLLSVYKKCL